MLFASISKFKCYKTRKTGHGSAQELRMSACDSVDMSGTHGDVTLEYYTACVLILYKTIYRLY